MKVCYVMVCDFHLPAKVHIYI